MSCSPARLAANRRNALRSTGPQSEAGKAASRRNAFQHGMAGAGDLIGPGEDAERIAHRAAAFARELGATGAMGRVLAHRAALLSVRMEQAASRDFAVVAANIQAARDQFDDDRAAAVEGWIEALEGSDDPHAALLGLETMPAGRDHLLASWLDLRRALAADDPAAAPRAALWLGLPAGSPPADRAGRGDTEVARLRLLVGSNDALEDALAAEREEVGLIASFDPSPEATLARRYEAAAERGLYRAMHAIKELRRSDEPGSTPTPFDLETDLSPSPPPAPSPPEPTAARPAEPPWPAPTPASLGSFRAGLATAPAPVSMTFVGPLEPPLLPAERRKQRPDLRKLAQSRR